MREGFSALGHRLAGSLVVRSPTNRAAAWILAVLGPLVVAAALLSVRSSVGLAGFLSGALLMVIAAAVFGGLSPAFASALLGVLLGAYSYSPPYDSLTFNVEADSVAFVGFVIVAIVVGILIDQLTGLAKQQAALRRVATLVAGGARPNDVLAAVTDEAKQQVSVDFARMVRHDSDDSITFVAASSISDDNFPVGTRWNLALDPEGKTISSMVLRTGRTARIDNFADLPGPFTTIARTLRIRCVVGAPIIVEGRTWGLIIVGSTAKGRLPADTEARLASFTDLLGTAIANAESRAELAASRARVVAAADEMRRRIERDLHDGTQQRLVSLGIQLRAAEASVPVHLAEQRAAFSRVAKGLAETVEELQEISRGIHPAILSKGGLKPALKTLARRSAVPVELDVDVDGRLPAQIEVAAYYVVSEALTNVAKHARASVAHVDAHATESTVELAVRDDGVGGADSARGSGLIGLRDRVEALGGTMTIAGAPGEGTSVAASIPIDRQSAPVPDLEASTAVG
jgi:signal transduction histidine kinase